MAKMIFVNLPVTDLARSMAFYEAVGFTNNPHVHQRAGRGDGVVGRDRRHAADPRVLEDLHQQGDPRRPRHRAGAAVPEPRQPGFGQRRSSTRPSAPAASPKPTPTQDMGFMYGRSFEDPDGHIWENVYMNMSGRPRGRNGGRAAGGLTAAVGRGDSNGNHRSNPLPPAAPRPRYGPGACSADW